MMKNTMELKKELDAADRELNRRYRFALWCEKVLLNSKTLEEYKANECQLQQAEDAVQAQAVIVQNIRAEWVKQDIAERL